MFNKTQASLLALMLPAMLTERGSRGSGQRRGLSHPSPSTQPKAGRNDLCPCGSHKKYKRCCRPKS
jgi:hypothetical protein